MAKPDDISSTERLLNVIRNTASVKETPVFTPPAPDRKLFQFAGKLFKRTAHSVGVDMAGDHLRLVKVRHRLDKNPVVLDFRSAPLSQEITGSREQTIDLLRSELARFCPPSPPTTIWTVLPLEETDIRSLRIPKIAKSKLENAVYWTYQKEAAVDTGKLLLDFRVLGDTIDNGVAKTEVVVCTAPRAKVDEVTALFREAGVDLTGIVAPAFSFQNFFKAGWFGVEETLACSLLIDFNWSRIDIFRPNGDLIVSRGIKAGIASMVESIKSEAARPIDNLSMADASDDASPVLELPVFEATEADQILQILSADAPAPSSAGEELIKSEDVFNMVLPALERLIRQVERTLEHVTLRFSDGPIEKMFFSGAISSYPQIVDHIGGQLGLAHEIIDPFAAVSGSVKPPESAEERAGYVSSAGLALSGAAHPPNFLFTHKESTHQRRKSRLHWAILFFFAVGMAAIWGSHLFQKQRIHDLETELHQLSMDANPEGIQNDRASLLALANQAKKKNRAWKTYSRNYLAVAVIGEITGLAPEHIRFIRIEGTGGKPEEKEPDEDQPEKTMSAETTAAVEAVVYGPDTEVEARLAQYLMALKRSKLFARVTLKQKNVDRLGSENVLRFSLSLEGA